MTASLAEPAARLATAAKNPSFAGVLLTDLALVFAMTLLLQVVVCLAENLGDETYFFRHYLNMEADRIAKYAGLAADGSIVIGPDAYPDIAPRDAAAYGFRISDERGRVLHISNPKLIERAATMIGGTARLPDFWFGKLDRETWFSAAGGVRREIGNRAISIEWVTQGDPANRRLATLLQEIGKDALAPVLPTILFVAFALLATLRRVLRPLNRIGGGATLRGTDIAKLPREVAGFASWAQSTAREAKLAISERDQLLARTAHELRTPLAIMLLELQRMKHPGLHQFESDVVALAQTLDRLVHLVRLDANDVEMVPVDLARIMEQAAASLEDMAEARHIDLRIASDPRLRLNGDPVAIGEAIRNLVENAIKYSPIGGSVAVECAQPGRVTIDDSGPGIDTADFDRLMQPFQRGKTAAEGAGLGLAIVRRAVKLHNGRISVSRSPLGGARIVLDFVTNALIQSKAHRLIVRGRGRR